MNLKPSQKRTASVSVPDYMCHWARRRFTRHPETGGLMLPPKLDVYHVVWTEMSRWPRMVTWMGLSRYADEPAGNLVIHLPDRHHRAGGIRKNPRVWNYLSPRSHRAIARSLKEMFDEEFHTYVNRKTSLGISRIDAVRSFSRAYGISIDSEDTLIKNYQRYLRKQSVTVNILEKRQK